MSRVVGKLGKLFGEPVAGVKWFDEYLTTGVPLPKPKRQYDYAGIVKKQGGFPMACNDRLGCCTISGIVHLLQLAYAVVGEKFVYPGDDAVEEEYFSETGGADSGLIETNVLQKGATVGIFGHKWKWAPIRVGDITTLEYAAYNFGGVYLGVALPQSAQQEFANSAVWRVIRGYDPIVGGHCITGSGWNTFGEPAETWGDTTSFTPAWWKTYGTNAYVFLPDIFEQVGHGPLAAVDTAQLSADIGSFV